MIKSDAEKFKTADTLPAGFHVKSYDCVGGPNDSPAVFTRRMQRKRIRTGFELVENQFKGAINKSLKALEDKEFHQTEKRILRSVYKFLFPFGLDLNYKIDMSVEEATGEGWPRRNQQGYHCLFAMGQKSKGINKTKQTAVIFCRNQLFLQGRNK